MEKAKCGELWHALPFLSFSLFFLLYFYPLKQIQMSDLSTPCLLWGVRVRVRVSRSTRLRSSQPQWDFSHHTSTGRQSRSFAEKRRSVMEKCVGNRMVRAWKLVMERNSLSFLHHLTLLWEKRSFVYLVLENEQEKMYTYTLKKCPPYPQPLKLVTVKHPGTFSRFPSLILTASCEHLGEMYIIRAYFSRRALINIAFPEKSARKCTSDN